ncbi:hypothetical protein [Actinomadura sp. 9N407]|uniref:hypothetical protein n=1 Tax=Actinomadura sp. 9N407 TaxID=3375154 RepID=UPI0037ADF8B0
MRFSHSLCAAALLAAACSGPPVTAPPPTATTSPAAAPSAPAVQAETPFFGCLRSHGVRLSEKNHEPVGDTDHIRKAIERCASLLQGQDVRIPVAKGSRFQVCLAEHGVKLPPVGEWLSIHPREPTMAQALSACA